MTTPAKITRITKWDFKSIGFVDTGACEDADVVVLKRTGKAGGTGKKCAHCGHQVAEATDSTICPQCGQPFEDGADAAGCAGAGGDEMMHARKRVWPSDDIDPEKARKILEDGEVNGQPLTEAQRRMFGAAVGRGRQRSQKMTAAEIDQAATELMAECGDCSLKAEYPWDQCLADAMDKYHDREIAEKVCGEIKARSEKRAATPQPVATTKQPGRFSLKRLLGLVQTLKDAGVSLEPADAAAAGLATGPAPDASLASDASPASEDGLDTTVSDAATPGASALSSTQLRGLIYDRATTLSDELNRIVDGDQDPAAVQAALDGFAAVVTDEIDERLASPADDEVNNKLSADRVARLRVAQHHIHAITGEVQTMKPGDITNKGGDDLAALTLKVGELTTQNEALSTENQLLKEQLAAIPPAEGETEDAVLKRIADPATRELVRKARVEAAESRQMVNEERQLRQTAEFTMKVKAEYPHLAVSPGDLAPIMMAIEQGAALTAEQQTTLKRVLKSADGMAHQLLMETGRNPVDTDLDDDVTAFKNKVAEEQAQGGSVAQATKRARTKYPDLFNKAMKAQQARGTEAQRRGMH